MTAQRHWPEYAIEAALLGLFMVSACAFTVLLEHPASPLRAAIADSFTRRALIGVAMGLTAIALIYSPWGQRSGAHFNPAVTLAFFRLGKIEPTDAVAYVVAQCVGGILGVLLSAAALGMLAAHPAVDFVVTVPGDAGNAAAFAGEIAIAFLTMTVVLIASNGTLARFTGLFCGALVATYIAFEAPLSGMSMNPARSLASAVVAQRWTGFWIYLIAPVLGMLAAAEVFLRFAGARRVSCAKLHHGDAALRCIFRCGADAVPTRRPARASNAACGTSVLLLVALACAGLPRQSLAAAPAEVPIESVGPVGITVSDLDRAVDFYARILGFTKVSEVEVAGDEVERLEGVFGLRMRVARMRLGDESIELVQFLAPRGRPLPFDSRANDRWFQHVAIIVSDMDRAYAWLRQNGVEHASTGPQTLPEWNRNAAGIRAFYFRDPDGHFLEILEFPPGKGAAKWHRPTNDLFLGIDHTAIVVGDTDASLRFYRDVLGMKIAGESDNYGTEQAHLNNVEGAHLRITSLRAPAGPGIELLEYLAPRDGRPVPKDQKANDLAQWQTRLATADADAAARALAARHVRRVSPGVVRMPDDTLGFGRGLLVRDPDGHALEIVGD